MFHAASEMVPEVPARDFSIIESSSDHDNFAIILNTRFKAVDDKMLLCGRCLQVGILNISSKTPSPTMAA